MKALVFIATCLCLAGLCGQALAEGRGKYPQDILAEVTEIVDGDTITFELEVLNISVRGECRMLQYNAPEMHGTEKPLGAMAKSRLAEILPVGSVAAITVTGKDRYGRFLCHITGPDRVSVNTAMRAYLEGINYAGVGKYDHLR